MEEHPDPPPPVPEQSASKPALPERESFWAMLAHLSIFTGYLSFVGFFLGPIVIWLLKKEDFPGLDAHFKEAINFQISMFLYLVIAVVVVVLTLGLGLLVAIPVFFIVGILDVVFPIIGAIKANDGQLFRYPLSLRFIK